MWNEALTKQHLQKIVQWIQAVDVATSHSVTVTVGFLQCLALYMHS